MAEASAEAACAAAAVAAGESSGPLCNSSLTAFSDDVTSPALHYTPALSYSLIVWYQALYATNMHGCAMTRLVSPHAWHTQGRSAVHTGGAWRCVIPRCASAVTGASITLYVKSYIAPPRYDTVQAELLQSTCKDGLKVQMQWRHE